MNPNWKENIHHKIDELMTIYKDNHDMLLKTEDYIMNQLPTMLNNINNTQLERESRKSILEEKSNEFMEAFLKKSHYYYCNTTEIFFEYKDGNYNCIREDTILYNILNAITGNKVIMPWKYKIKTSLLKRIKERDIFNSTPNTETIQCVLSIFEQYFNMSKETAKYFLTIVGDIMFKKNNNLYFINSDVKQLLKEINNNGYLLFGMPNLTTHFKYKYHEHTYSDCRLIDFRGKINEETVKNAFKNNTINTLLVGCYFSNKYTCADIFIQDFCKDFTLKKHAHYLKNNSEETIVQYFITEMTEVSNESSIGWKEVSYLWKTYNEKHNYPSIMFQTTLKEHLIGTLGEKYDKEEDVFIHMTSSYLPDVQKFLDFWNKEIYETDEQIEYEIDEIYNLFQSSYKSNTMTEDKLLGLIKHYYSEVVIEDGKYFLNIGCHLWDKKKEAQDYLCQHNIELSANTCVDDFYESYKTHIHNPKKRLSKHYFEKFISEQV